MIYLTSEEHYFNENIIRYCNRPFANAAEMNAGLISRHNKTVLHDSDITFHLGDFCFGNTKQYREILEQLNGRHVLIVGNHDGIGHSAARSAGFDLILYEAIIGLGSNRIRLSHYPYRYSRISSFIYWCKFGKWPPHIHKFPVNDGRYLLHGHNHNGPVLRGKQINICVDLWKYCPVSLNTIAAIIAGEGNK